MIFVYELFILTFSFIVCPIAIAFGWVRWSRKGPISSSVSNLSLIGHLVATVTILLAVASILLADRFRLWDHSLQDVHYLGFGFGALALILSLVGT